MLDDLRKAALGLTPEELEENLRRAFEAGWDARFGPPPFKHGAFVEALRHSFDLSLLDEIIGGAIGGVGAPLLGGGK